MTINNSLGRGAGYAPYYSPYYTDENIEAWRDLEAKNIQLQGLWTSLP